MISCAYRIFRETTLVVGFLLGTAFPLEAVAQERERIQIATSDMKLPEAYDLATSEIGIVPAEGAAEAAIVRAQRQLGAEVVADYPGNFTVLSLGEPRRQDELARIAIDLRESGDEILQAGLVIYPVGSQTPLLAPDEVIVQFVKEFDVEEVRTRTEALGLEPVMENPGLRGQWLMRQLQPSERSIFDVSRAAMEIEGVEFAHPNLIPVIDYRQFMPNDTLFANEWHHNNTGQGGGTIDADSDTLQAWNMTLGLANVTLAVLDSGFDLNHQDIQPNVWSNPGEVAGNNADDDSNGYVDDVNGYRFNGCTAMTGTLCGSGTVTGGNHGMSVAGVAAARGHNGLGVIGACPNCSIIPLQQGTGFFADALAVAYPGLVGADIFTNSWGYNAGTAVPMNVAAAIQATANAGTTIFWAMNNGSRNDCTGVPDISANPNVIAVSAISNQDRKVTESAFGNCMELLSPTHRGYGPNPNGGGAGVAFTGTLNITTTDRPGNAGYNNTSPQNNAVGFDPNFCPAEQADRNYTNCFGGTSSATPFAAGIAGLVLSADGALTRQQVQRVLQDTADKPEDSAGAYAESTGFSTPATGVATHGFGRVNAFEAVRLVAPSAVGGRGGRDIFIRDNRLDWGNTEQPSNVLMEPARGFIPHYQSVDIKVDAPPYEPAPPVTSPDFDAFPHENPKTGEVNKVYVRVHNRGHQSVDDVTVKLHWAFAGTALPALPGDFWSQFPNDSTDPTSPWTSIGATTVGSVGYSGASVGGTAADASPIVAFDWTGPALDPSLPDFRHHCLFVVISAPDDPVSANSTATLVPDLITPTDNNVTHRNVSVEDSGRSGRFVAGFMVRNPFPEERILTKLVVHHPRGWNVALSEFGNEELFELEAGKEVPIEIRVAAPDKGAGTVEVVQEVLRREEERFEPLGGFSFDFVRPVSGKLEEDCIVFNPENLSVRPLGNVWVLSDNAVPLALLATENDGMRAREFAKTKTALCFIGRGSGGEMGNEFVVKHWE